MVSQEGDIIVPNRDGSNSAAAEEPDTSTVESKLTQTVQLWRDESKDRPPVIVTAGKSGVGKSTMINNFLELNGKDACLTGDDADATTVRPMKCEKERNGLLLKLIDTPGIGGIKTNETKVALKQLSTLTEEKADILLYCISLHSSAKPDAGDVEIIKMLNSSFGSDIWKHTILILTFANIRKSRGKESYKKLIEDYAKLFQDALRAAKVKGIQVKSVFSEEEGVSVIPAIPVGETANDEQLPLGKNWSDILLEEALKRSDPYVALQLLKWKELLPPQTAETVAEVGGGVMAGAGLGVAVGAATGVPLAILGVALGIPVGALIGGIVGGISGLVPLLRRRKQEREQSQAREKARAEYQKKMEKREGEQPETAEKRDEEDNHGESLEETQGRESEQSHERSQAPAKVEVHSNS